MQEEYNQNCKKCNRETRLEIIDEGSCREALSMIDGLPVRCVGDWAYEKIYRLNQYFGIFAIGMKNKWSGLNYIEICSGPGRCIDRYNGKEFDGTALTIINHKSFEFIKKAIFIDNNIEVIETLNKRLQFLGKSHFAKAVEGDYNNIEQIELILSKLPQKCLNLVLLDPTDCSVPFSLIKVIDKSLINTDFIMNVAFGTDLKRGRNLRNAILNDNYPSRVKYESFLGSADFFENIQVIETAKKGTEDNLIRLFLSEYKKNLTQIGFKQLDLEPVKQYYYLLYASKSKRGLDFWQKANSIDPTGQYNIKFQ